MLINDNLDWGLKDGEESGLKRSHCKHTPTLTHTHTRIHELTRSWVRVAVLLLSFCVLF